MIVDLEIVLSLSSELCYVIRATQEALGLFCCAAAYNAFVQD